MYKNINDWAKYISKFFNSYFQQEPIEMEYIEANLLEEILFSLEDLKDKIFLTKQDQQKRESFWEKEYDKIDSFLQVHIPNYPNILKSSVKNIIMDNFFLEYTNKRKV